MPKLAHGYYLSAFQAGVSVLRAADCVLQVEEPARCGLGFRRTRRLQFDPGTSAELWVTTSIEMRG